jgi:hypothetical protein
LTTITTTSLSSIFTPHHEKNYNALIELAEEIRHIDSHFSDYQLIIAADFNCPFNKSEIKKKALKGIKNNLARGENNLDYFISKNIEILSTTPDFEIGMTDHKYITLNIKTIDHLKGRII